ncbi:MAG TPA: restriction endonuclease subunit S [Candidatus Ornithospirochaeta avicola]|uniref:Restriction endonuclease subunit S n=1 Tax=Candidatus Ornithospirochaeta avicola TaxID=2840896 RepID=A0A9D1PT64_9SPIO|nr:restriction endonuclease subunit S [Candidatus Ornithospirochaeta avicola]
MNEELCFIKTYNLGDIAKFTYGFTDKAADVGTVRFIRITDIDEYGCLRTTPAKYIDITKENKDFLIEPGDLLMARTGATFGKTVSIPDGTKGIYASFLIKIQPDNSKLMNRYYWFFAQSSMYWQQANALVTTGGQPQFNANSLAKIRISVPSIEYQKAIISVLNKFDSLCNDLSEGLPAEIEARKKQYEYYRDKLLDFKEKEA